MKFELNPKDFNNWVGLHRLLVTCFAYMDDIIDPPSSLHKMTIDSLKIKAKTEDLLVVHDDNQLIACAYFEARSDVIYIGKVAVAQNHRGKGIAAKIFSFAARLAEENDKSYLELETRIELTNNHAAFEKMGFKITEHNSHHGYNRPTSVTMRKAV